MTKNSEIIQEAKKQYAQDLETVLEMVKFLQGNKNLLGLKFQTDCIPFKFTVEDLDAEYTAIYRYNCWNENADNIFGINKGVKNPENPSGERINTTLGIINISRGTFTSNYLKEFAKVLQVYKDLMEEDFVTSAKEYLA